MHTQTNPKQHLRTLVRAYKAKKCSDVLLPYKQEIYTLRMHKRAPLSHIRSLLKQAGIPVSQNVLAYFCKKYSLNQSSEKLGSPLAHESQAKTC